MADDDLSVRVAALEDQVVRLRAHVVALDLAVAALTARLPALDPPQAKRTLFGIEVLVAPGVDEDRIRQAIDEAPGRLGADELVDHLEELGLLARVKSSGR